MKPNLLITTSFLMVFTASYFLTNNHTSNAMNTVSPSEASTLVGGSSDGYYRASNSGCGAYSKVGSGGVVLRCSFQDTCVASNWIFGIWGRPGLTQNCIECGITCGSVQFIGQPNES